MKMKKIIIKPISKADIKTTTTTTTTTTTKSNSVMEKMQILHSSENIIKKTIDDFHLIKEKFDICTDLTDLLYLLILHYGGSLLLLKMEK